MPMLPYECSTCGLDIPLSGLEVDGSVSVCPACGAEIGGDLVLAQENDQRNSSYKAIVGGVIGAAVVIAFYFLISFWGQPKDAHVADSEVADQPATPISETNPGGLAFPASESSTELITDKIESHSPAANDSADAMITNVNDPTTPAGRFTFASGDDYQFRYELICEIDGRTETTTGTCAYHVVGREQKSAAVVEQQQGSGSAFVISPDGILVTCAHVVEDAEEVDVELSGKTYTAEVLHVDSASDLAFIKIAASDLPALQLANSDEVQLGQDIRAVGFPLSDVLGTNVKVTRGTISGVLLREGQNQLQVDAAINPGNSGGPIINDKGEVVGVASSKLSGVEVSRVGFCIPANQLQQLAKSIGEPTLKSTSEKELTGPELVAKVTPSVAFVKVRSGSDRDSTYTDLAFNSSHHKMVRNARGLSIPSFRTGISRPSFGRGTLLLSQRGEIVRTSEEEQLPFLIGPPSQLPLFEFSKRNQRTWTKKRRTTLVHEKRQSPESGIPLPSFRDPFRRRRSTEIVKVLPALETREFTIEKEDDLSVEITEKYSFRTSAPHDGQTIGMHGSGKIVFDKRRGFTAEYEFEGTYYVETEQVTLKVPLKLSGSLLTKTEMEEQSRRIADAQRKFDAEANIVNGADAPPVLSKLVRHQIPDAGWGVKSLVFSPDNRLLAVGKSDKKIEIYNVESGERVFSEDQNGNLAPISAVAFSPDGKLLLAGGLWGIIKIFSVTENGELSYVGEFPGHSREVSTIVIGPDSEHVLSGGTERRVRCWNLKDFKEQFAIAGWEHHSIAAQFLSESKAIISDGKTIKEVSIESGDVTQTLELPEAGFAHSLSFSHDGEEIVHSDGYSLKRWSTSTGEKLPELRGKEVLWAADYTPEGTHIIAGGRGHLVIWNVASKTLLGHVPLGESLSYIKPLAISPNGRYVACCPNTSGQALWIFDIQSAGEAE